MNTSTCAAKRKTKERYIGRERRTMAIYAGKSILKNFAGDLEVRLRETTPSYSVFFTLFRMVFFY